MRKLYDEIIMAQVKLTVTDDDGKVIGIHNYDLSTGLKTLNQMESAIEQLRPQMLSDINKDLLEEEQRVFQKKRRSPPEGNTR